MPNLDKTGPGGEGPKTGRGKGQCDPKEPVLGRAGLGRGCRWDKGLGLGKRQKKK